MAPARVNYEDAIKAKPVTKVSSSIVTDYAVDLTESWSIGQVPHGGFLAALLLNTSSAYWLQAEKNLDQPDPIHIFITFVNRAQLGDAIVRIETIKKGKNYSNLRLLLLQGDVQCLHAYVTMANIEREEGLNGPSSTKKPALHPDDVPQIKVAASDFRHAANHLIYKEVPQTNEFEMEQWFAFKDSRSWDTPLLGYASDLTLPVMKYAKGGWFPTLSLNLEIKARPQTDTKWLQCLTQVKSLRNGRHDTDVELRDEDGNLLATARHVTLVVGVERNLAKRGGSKM